MTVHVRDLATGAVTRVEPMRSGPRARRPGRPSTLRSRPTGTSSRSRPTDAGRNGAPSENGLWVVDRKAERERLVTDASRGAAYLPEVRRGRALGRLHVGRGRQPRAHPRLQHRARDGPDDGSSPARRRARRRGRVRPERVATTAASSHSPAARATWAATAAPTSSCGTCARARRGLVTGAIKADAGSPSLSADGRYVAFVVRVGRPNGKRESLRSRVWRHDLATGENVLVEPGRGRAR